MNDAMVAKELLRVSLDLQDSPEDIAADVASRIVEKGTPIREAFRSIGYGPLFMHTRESDMPNGWETFSFEEMVKVLTKAIEKAHQRWDRVASASTDRIANEVVSMDFPSEDAMNKYIKKHPGTNRSSQDAEARF